MDQQAMKAMKHKKGGKPVMLNQESPESEIPAKDKVQENHLTTGGSCWVSTSERDTRNGAIPKTTNTRIPLSSNNPAQINSSETWTANFDERKSFRQIRDTIIEMSNGNHAQQASTSSWNANPYRKNATVPPVHCILDMGQISTLNNTSQPNQTSFTRIKDAGQHKDEISQANPGYMATHTDTDKSCPQPTPDNKESSVQTQDEVDYLRSIQRAVIKRVKTPTIEIMYNAKADEILIDIDAPCKAQSEVNESQQRAIKANESQQNDIEAIDSELNEGEFEEEPYRELTSSDKTVRRGFNVIFTCTVVVSIILTAVYIWAPVFRSFIRGH